jgi:hypothetical protein
MHLAFDDPDVLVGLEDVGNGGPVRVFARLDAVDTRPHTGAADDFG